MPAQVLRPYQQNGISQILAAYRGGARSVLAVAPTGSGKTTVFSSVLSELAGRGQRGAVLVHRRELAAQACTRLREFGVRYGLIMAGEHPNPSGLVQVASVDTLAGRIRENTTLQRWAASVRFVVYDEAHLSTAPKWRRALDYFTNALVLGVTATPWRLSGKPLAGAYGSCVVIATPQELREQGHLCGYQGFGYLAPDLSEVHTTAGEYNERESAAAMSESAIVDSVVEEWGQHARELSTVVFAVTVDHSQQLAARFKAAGVSAEHLDGKTPGEARKRILKRVADGHTRVLCNVGVAVEGLDIPRLKCCVLARPTKSLARAIQMMGRVRRPWAECPCGHGFVPKLHALGCPSCGGRSWKFVTARIHDHAFNIRAHGLPDDDRDYTLTAKLDKPPSLSTCKACRALYSGARCTACSAEPETGSTERVLQMVSAEGLERREFDSGAPAVPAPEPAARNPVPVKIEWGAVKPGRKLAGKYLGASTEDTQHGKRNLHHLQGDSRDYSLAGAARLDKAMARVPVGSPVSVVYLGRERHEKAPHLFDVEFDDGAISG
jgi:DNA repair protein RadD